MFRHKKRRKQKKKRKKKYSLILSNVTLVFIHVATKLANTKQMSWE